MPHPALGEVADIAIASDMKQYSRRHRHYYSFDEIRSRHAFLGREAFDNFLAPNPNTKSMHKSHAFSRLVDVRSAGRMLTKVDGIYLPLPPQPFPGIKLKSRSEVELPPYKVNTSSPRYGKQRLVSQYVINAGSIVEAGNVLNERIQAASYRDSGIHLSDEVIIAITDQLASQFDMSI
jgi:hypothetical protein